MLLNSAWMPGKRKNLEKKMQQRKMMKIVNMNVK